MNVLIPLLLSITLLYSDDGDYLSTPLSPNNNNRVENISLGIGYGLDYGGLGGKTTIYLSERLGLFVGFGNTVIGTSYNLGPIYRFYSGKDHYWNPYLIVMFGNNSIVEFPDKPEKNRFFEGTTLGIGISRKSPYSRHIFEGSFNLIVRDSRSDTFVDDQIDQGENVNFFNDWFGISLGYKFVLF